MRKQEQKEICKECSLDFTRLASHVQKEHGSFQDYLLKHSYSGVWPLCKCGCGQLVEFKMTGRAGFREYIHGHHMRGRIVLEETREKIGKKNSIAMKKFCEENPAIIKERVERLRNGITPESEERRLAATKKTYEEMSSEDKNRFSEHTSNLWESGILREAHEKAVETLKEGFRTGRLQRTQEQKDAISKTITNLYLDGGFQWSKGHHLSPKTGKKHYYRSSWELRHMKEMDEDPKVKVYSYEPFSIDYVWEGESRRYIPDFLVELSDGSFELQEIGPENVKEENSRNRAKTIAALDLCREKGWSFKIISF